MTDLVSLVSTPGWHKDARRKIIDLTSRVKYVKVYQDVPLGNHYHIKTPEQFYVMYGELKVKLEDLRTKTRKCFIIKPGDSIDVPLFLAHKVIATPGTEFLNICGVDFDPTDLHRYEINW